MKEKNKEIRLKLMINHMKITFRYNKLFTSLKRPSQKWNIDISHPPPGKGFGEDPIICKTWRGDAIATNLYKGWSVLSDA